jgi:hypothetical protein
MIREMIPTLISHNSSLQPVFNQTKRKQKKTKINNKYYQSHQLVVGLL